MAAIEEQAEPAAAAEAAAQAEAEEDAVSTLASRAVESAEGGDAELEAKRRRSRAEAEAKTVARRSRAEAEARKSKSPGGGEETEVEAKEREQALAQMAHLPPEQQQAMLAQIMGHQQYLRKEQARAEARAAAEASVAAAAAADKETVARAADSQALVDKLRGDRNSRSSFGSGGKGKEPMASPAAPRRTLRLSVEAGSKVGLGLQLNKAGKVAVNDVQAGSLAEAKGLQLESVLTFVNGQSTEGADVQGVLKMMRAVEGSRILDFTMPDGGGAGESGDSSSPPGSSSSSSSRTKQTSGRAVAQASAAGSVNVAGAEELLAYTFGAGPIGIELKGKLGVVTVRGVDAGSAAEAQGVQLASELVRIHETPVIGMDTAGVLQVLKSTKRPLTLFMRPPPAGTEKQPPMSPATPAPPTPGAPSTPGAAAGSSSSMPPVVEELAGAQVAYRDSKAACAALTPSSSMERLGGVKPGSPGSPKPFQVDLTGDVGIASRPGDAALTPSRLQKYKEAKAAEAAQKRGDGSTEGAGALPPGAVVPRWAMGGGEDAGGDGSPGARADAVLEAASEAVFAPSTEDEAGGESEDAAAASASAAPLSGKGPARSRSFSSRMKAAAGFGRGSSNKGK